jgi:hypothetical protein
MAVAPCAKKVYTENILVFNIITQLRAQHSFFSTEHAYLTDEHQISRV